MQIYKKEEEGNKRKITLFGFVKISYKEKQVDEALSHLSPEERKIIQRFNKIKAKKGYHSQIGQDMYIDEYFKHKKNGVCIDIGANDGVTLSNSKYFDKLGWTCICVEPNPDVYSRLQLNRPNSSNFNVAIGNSNEVLSFTKVTGDSEMLSGITADYSEEHKERIRKEVGENGGSIEEIQVQSITFDKLLEQFPKVKTIDFLSIDTEGNEFKILKTIDFSKYDITTLSIENNYNDSEIREYMEERGYRCVKCWFDDIYIKK